MKAYDTPIRVGRVTGPTGFLDAYDAITGNGKSPEEVASAQVGLLQQWVVERPAEASRSCA